MLGLLSFAPQASADAGLQNGFSDQVAWGLIDCQNGGECGRNLDYEHKVVSVQYEDVGVYDVIFDLSRYRGPYNYQVTAVGEVDAHCKTAFPLLEEDRAGVRVLCFDPSGAPVDAQFTAFGQYHWSQSAAPNEVGFMAYAASDIEESDFRYSTAGLDMVHMLFNFFSASTYVDLFGHTTGDGAPLVTAKGDDANRCFVGAVEGYPEGTVVEVRCVDPSNKSVPAHFDITYMHELVPAYDDAASGSNARYLAGAYALLDHDSRHKDAVFPEVQYNNASGGFTMIERSGEGTYTVYLDGLDPRASTTQVVAVGDSRAQCRVAGLPWGISTVAAVDVICQDDDGDLIDSGFALMHQTCHRHNE